MGRKASASTVILIILIIISLSMAGGVFYLFQKERVEKLRLNDKLEEINVSLEKTKVELANSKREISAFEFRLKDAQVRIERLSGDLEQEKNSKQESLRQIDKLTAELEQQKASRLNLESQLQQARDEVKQTQVQLKGLELRKMQLEAKVNELEARSQSLESKVEGIELGKIVVGPETTTEPIKTQAYKAPKTAVFSATGLEGKLLVVNKDYNFAVINLGSKDGVGTGDIFSIYHGNKYIGDVKVEKTHDSMAAAGFLGPDTKNKVSEGDKVVKKGR